MGESLGDETGIAYLPPPFPLPPPPLPPSFHTQILEFHAIGPKTSLFFGLVVTLVLAGFHSGLDLVDPDAPATRRAAAEHIRAVFSKLAKNDELIFFREELSMFLAAPDFVRPSLLKVCAPVPFEGLCVCVCVGVCARFCFCSVGRSRKHRDQPLTCCSFVPYLPFFASRCPRRPTRRHTRRRGG